MSKPEKPVHPGKILSKEFLTPRSFTIQQFSNQTGISSKHVNDIINGKRAISKNTASILSLWRSDKFPLYAQLNSPFYLH